MNSGKNCVKCGFSLFSDLPFCPYCGSIEKVESVGMGRWVMILKNVQKKQLAEEILRKTFSIEASRSLHKALGKKTISVMEDTSKGEDPWLEEQLRNAGASVDYIPMDTWYFKLSSLIIFCLIVCPAIYWSMTGLWKTTSELGWWGFRAFQSISFLIPVLLIGFSILIFVFLFIISIKRHYVPIAQIPGSFVRGVLSSGHIFKSTKLIQRVFVPCLIFTAFVFTLGCATFLICKIVIFISLMLVEYVINGYMNIWSSLYNAPYYIYALMYSSGLLILKIFVGTIYTRPLFDKQDRILLSAESQELQNRSIYTKLEKIRLLSESVTNRTFRYAIADLFAYYLSFAVLLKQSSSSDDMYLADINRQMEAYLDSALTIGGQIQRLDSHLSEFEYEKAKKKMEQIQYELSKIKQEPRQFKKDEIKKVQETIINHESSSEVFFVSLNTLNQIIGGIKALSLQVSELANDNSCDLNHVKMNLAMLSENLNSLNITKPTAYGS